MFSLNGNGWSAAADYFAGRTLTHVLDPGSRLSGALPAREWVRYEFHSAAGEVVFVGLRATGFSPWLRLFGPDGELLQELRESGSGGTLGLQLSATGVHRILLGGQTLDEFGTYQITLLAISDDFAVPDGEPGGPLTSGHRQQAELRQGDFTIWTFPAQEGDGLMVRAGSSAFSPWLRLHAPTGALIDERRDPWSGNRDNFVTAQAPATGVYIAVVSAVQLGQSGSYRLHLAKAPGEFVTPDGEEGGLLIRDQVHSGTLDRGGLDLWSFTGSVGEGVTLSIDAAGIAPWIRAYGPDGSVAAEFVSSSSSSRAGELSLTLTLNGPYTVVMSATALGQSGTYELRFEAAENGSGGSLPQ